MPTWRFAFVTTDDFVLGVEKKIEGTWQMIRAELAGVSAPEMVTEHTVVSLGAGSYAVSFGGAVEDRGTYELQAAAEHASMVLRGVVGPNAGRTIPCIFQIMGDRLRVCYGLDGVLPVEFAAREGEQRYLVTYRRIGDERP